MQGLHQGTAFAPPKESRRRPESPLVASAEAKSPKKRKKARRGFPLPPTKNPFFVALKREVVNHPGGVCVAALDEDNNLSFSRIAKDFASAEATKGLSGRPLETFGPLLRMGDSTKNRFLVDGKENPFLTSSRFTEGFASAEATKGLSDRPLETFGGHPC